MNTLKPCHLFAKHSIIDYRLVDNSIGRMSMLIWGPQGHLFQLIDLIDQGVNRALP